MRVISECDISLDWNLLNQIGLNHNSERRLYKVWVMMKSVISSDKHMLNQRERDALHHGPDFIADIIPVI